jgi:hypothetical protein
MSKRNRFLDEKVTPDRRPDTRHRLIKPRQVRDYPKWCKRLLEYLLESGKDRITLTVGEKADGHSVLFECLPGGAFQVHARTETGKLLLYGDDASRYVTTLACDLRMKLKCELRALYDGREMGFLEVLSMLKTFHDNKAQNVGKFQLQICPFGIYSLSPDSSVMSERACSFLPRKIVDEMLREAVRPDSTLMTLVRTTQYQVRLYDMDRGKHGLEFLSTDGTDTVARGQQEFFNYLIAQADAKGIEGFVLKADPIIFAAEPVVTNKYGTRDQSAVKVKREFKVTLLACRVRDVKNKRTLIYAFGLDASGGIVYAGEHTKHERLSSMLPESRSAFSFKNKQEREALYTLTRAQLEPKRALIKQFKASCTNMSKNRFCPIGLKIHDMVFLPVDPDSVSVLQHVAEANPHFRATTAASNEYALAIDRKKGSGKRKPQQPEPVSPKRVCHEAPASLSFDDFMDQMGEQFQPPPPREPEPEVVPEPEVTMPEAPDEPAVDHRVLEDAAYGAYVASLKTDSPLPPYRTLDPPVRVYVDMSRDRATYKLLTQKIRFLGGTVVNKLGPDVSVMVSSRRFDDRVKLCQEHGAPTVPCKEPGMIQLFLRECAQC